MFRVIDTTGNIVGPSFNSRKSAWAYIITMQRYDWTIKSYNYDYR